MELDLVDLVFCSVVALILVAVPLMSAHPEGTRRVLGPPARVLAGWAVEHLRPVDEPDPLAEALRAQIRREKLVADVQRLRRLVATDMTMSAVRQIGNRMAYASLLQELEAWREPPAPAAEYTFAALGGPVGPQPGWRDELLRPAPMSRSAVHDGQRAPAVEVLELGPRRRATR